MTRSCAGSTGSFVGAIIRRMCCRFRRQGWSHVVGTLGDLAISYDRAREQARELGHRTEDELRVLLLHGVLHLIGLDHERDAGRMARIEKRWRKCFGLPAGLIERVRA